MKKAFTLIELLIVVAIIAILAAIAVPNFLEAQVRSKVARVRSELRTIATAIESYTVDNNKPPPMSISAGPGPFAPIALDPGDAGTGTLTSAITTPVAYITSFLFFDPFANNDKSIPIDERLYTYQAYQWIWPEPITVAARPDTTDPAGNEAFTGTQFTTLYGRWRTLSIGPDRNYYNVVPRVSSDAIAIPYDATNGTVSPGNIIRSQKESEQKSFIKS